METGAHVDPDADCERWREISRHGGDETGTQVPVKRLVLQHFPRLKAPLVLAVNTASMALRCRSAGNWIIASAKVLGVRATRLTALFNARVCCAAFCGRALLSLPTLQVAELFKG